MAVTHYRSGNRKASRTALSNVLELSPDHPDALHFLANLDGDEGELVSAEKRVTRALAVRPEFPPYLITLARIQAALGRNELAIVSLRAAMERDPTSVGLNDLGLLYLKNEQAEEAARAFEQALKCDPGSVAARINLGVSRFASGHVRQAAGHLQRALDMVPTDDKVAQRLGIACQACGEHERAVNAFSQALKYASDSPDLHTSLGISYTALGCFKQAETSFNEALRIDPAFVAASAGKAELLEWQGEYSQGMSLLQPLLAAQTDDPAVLTVYARLLRRTGDAGKGMDVLQPLAESGRVSGAPLRQVRFTLGDLSDQLRRYDEAFCWYKLARQYRPNTFSAAAHRRFIDDLLLRFDSKSTQQLNRSGNNSTQPIFIVGMPRSGTSLTEQILAAHPDVFAAGERSHIGRIVQQIAPLRNPTRAVLARHAHAYLNGLGDSSRAAQRFTDKMPLNFLYLGWIAQLFPKARIVWCRRDPRDTGLSCFTTNFIDPALAFSDELEDIALYSNSCVELMAHWQNTLDLTIFELQYESLVREPESILRELLSVLELDWNEACLAFHESSRIAKTSSHAQVREPFYISSIGRWQKYATHLEPLIAALRHDD